MRSDRRARSRRAPGREEGAQEQVMTRTDRGRRPERPRRTSGFTLVELLVALFILSIGILSVARLFIFSQHHAFHGRTETQATALAEEIREKILSENFDDLVSIFDGVDTSVPGTVTLPCQPWAGHLAAGLGMGGRGRIQVLRPFEDPEIVDGMLTITIEISWDESGQARSLPLRFSVAQMGV
jgi:prepilin-type N-terminal cleavage/methylation domain-containing protein